MTLKSSSLQESGSDFKGGECNWSVAMKNVSEMMQQSAEQQQTDRTEALLFSRFLQIHDATDQKQQFDAEVFMSFDRRS